jgi:hypothetical protein
MYKGNISAFLCNHCCCRKAISISYSECVCSLSYPACKRHVPYCHLWPACLYQSFPHYLINGLTFGRELLNIKCEFCLSLHILSETFLTLRRIVRDIINIQRSSCKVSVIVVRF